MRSKDYRKQAWSALSGNWGIAILAGLVASLLGGVSMLASDSVSVNINIDSLDFDAFGENITTLSEKPLFCLCFCAIYSLLIWILPYKHAALAAFYRSINPIATTEKNADNEKASTNDNASVDDAASANNI